MSRRKIPYFNTFVAGLCASSALASSAVQARNTSLEEIVVTAQKREQNMQDVPIAISAFSGDTLSALGLKNVVGLSEVTPGLAVAFNAGRANPFIRGVGANIGAAGNEMPVAMYFDGQYVSDSISATYFEFFGIERLEVLKGPQGTLFGRNATGGAINIVTHKPASELSGKFEATYGNYGTREAKAYLSGPLNSDAGWFASIDLITKTSDGYINNRNPLNGLGDSDVGSTAVDALRAKLLWEAADNLSLTLIVDSAEADDFASAAWQPMNEFSTVGEGMVELGLLPPELGMASRKPYDYRGSDAGVFSSQTWGANFTVDWSTEFANIKYIGTYRDVDNRQAVDADVVAADIFSFDSDQYTNTSQHEIQLISNSDAAFSWTAGVFYLNDEAYYDSLGLFIGVPRNATPQELVSAMEGNPNAAVIMRDNGRTSESWAVYGEGYYELSEKATLTLGLRYTWENLELHEGRDTLMLPDDSLNPVGFSPLVVFRGSEAKESFQEPTWSVVLDHHFSGDIMGYASYKRGYKSGVYSIADPTAREATDSEVIDAYEFGVKTTLRDGSLRMNAAVFYYDYKNLQVSMVNPETGGASDDNAAEVEIKGLDLDIQWVPIENLTVLAGLSLLDAEYKEYEDAAVLLPHPAGLGFIESTADISGMQVPNAADYQFNLGVDYYLSLGNSGALSFSANAFYTDDISRRSITAWGWESYERVSASVTWDSPKDRFYIKLWGNNLTDERVANDVTGLALGYMQSYSAPRTYGLSTGMRFGN